MTKADTIEEIMAMTGLSRKDVSVTVDAFMEVIRKNMIEKRENVYLRGFGSFVVKHRPEKKARNINKNTTVFVPAHDMPVFKVAKTFVEKMKNS